MSSEKASEMVFVEEGKRLCSTMLMNDVTQIDKSPPKSESGRACSALLIDQ